MNFDFSGLNVGQTASGAVSFADISEMRKALEAGYGSDVANLTGGGALRIQSLDKTMMATIQQNQHFKLFNKLQSQKATATVDEWTEQDSVGGFLGGSTNTESGNIASAQGSYARRVGLVKYLMTKREITLVTSIQNNIADAEATEYANGALQLLTDAEYLCFEGDSSVSPTEIDGIYTQINSLGSSDHVLDAEAKSLASIHLVNKAAATVAGYGNFGRPTDLFMSYLTQADFDNNLDPAFRVPLPGIQSGGISIGAPVVGIRTSHGDIATQADVFIRDENMQTPFDVRYPAIATANAAIKPVSAAGVAASDAASKFGAAHAGDYYYAVAGVSKDGQSGITKSAAVTVAAGEKVTLTITDSAGAAETGYAIYRSRKDGTDADADFREVARVPNAGATTVWVDLNRDIPGTSKAYMVNMVPGMSAITWRQMMPMIKFPLYPTSAAVIPWAQLMFGYLRIAKRKQHVVIKNILPDGANWRPFG